MKKNYKYYRFLKYKFYTLSFNKKIFVIVIILIEIISMGLIINKFNNYNNKISSNNVNKIKNAVAVCDENHIYKPPVMTYNKIKDVDLITEGNVIYNVNFTSKDPNDTAIIYDGNKEIMCLKSNNSLHFERGLQFVNEIGVSYVNDGEIFYANKE